MKKITSSTVIGFSLLLLTACSRSNSVTANTTQVVTSGTWSISLFTDNGNDETSNFTGFRFAFNTNGILSVQKNSITQSGTWSVDETSNIFNIDLGPKDNTNQPLGNLTDNWLIISKSNNLISLMDNNPSSNELLYFIRN